MVGKCPMCGAPMDNGACEYCGYKETVTPPLNVNITSSNPSQGDFEAPRQFAQYDSPKDKITTLLLCIFLGIFGAHRFYVGKIGTAILYFFTAGLFGIGWFVDILMIATGSFRDKYGLLITK